MFSIEQIEQNFSHKLEKGIKSKDVLNKTIEKIKFIIRETCEIHEVLKIHCLKVIVCLKKFNAAKNYEFIQNFFFRQFSFHVK